MKIIRRFFSRMQLLGRDVHLIRGICRQVDWYCFLKTPSAPQEEK